MDKPIILVPTDFSSNSEAALDVATSLARAHDAMLLIVHVQWGDTVVDAVAGQLLLDEDRDYIRHHLNQVRPKDPTVGYSQELLHGEPAAEIIKCAKENKVEMIVIGTHGRTGLKRALLGSIAEVVLRKAPCPVISVKPSS